MSVRPRSLFVLVAAFAGASACTLLTDLDGFAVADAGAPEGGASDGGGDGAAAVDLVDDSAAELALGQHVDTRADGTALTLATAKTSGDYLSRVFDLGSARKPSAIEWRPAAPYAKALPDRAQAESGYASAAIDMRDDLLLAHFDDDVSDTSGLANAIGLGGAVAFGPALFGRGFADTAQSWAYVMMSSATPFAFGTSDFTWSVWIKTTSRGCTSNNGMWGNQVYMGGQDADTRPHTWLGCSASSDVCPNKDGTGRVSGYISTTADDGKEYCGRRVIDDGAWHHLALVKQGHASASVVIYVDGSVESTLSVAFTGTFAYGTPSQLAIGAFSLGAAQGQSDALLDEVAIFRRALTGPEVAALSSRGHQRALLSVRACATATCTENAPFVGPGGDPAKTFADTGLSPPARGDLSFLPETRFVQYRLHLETDDPAVTPRVESVAIVAP